MNLITFHIPEDSQQLATWIEQQLVGRELRRLVIELKAILGTSVQSELLKEICGDRIPEVLQQGLMSLSPAALRRLLKSPDSLFALQELVLIEGADYWQTVPRSTEHQQTIVAGLDGIQAAIATQSPLQTKLPVSKGRFRLIWGTISAVAVAACLFLAVSLWRPPAGAPTWGFDRPGVLTAKMSPREYLDSLATAADDWFKKRPADQPALEKRLAEFRHGCDTLIAAEHPQLAETDRAWLRERCGVWALKIDGHLRDLSSGTKPLNQVQSDADATITALTKALRARNVTA